MHEPVDGEQSGRSSRAGADREGTPRGAFPPDSASEGPHMSRHLGKAAGLAGGAFALAAALAISLIGAAPAAAGPETASLRGRTFDQRIRAAG
jgi:hypothetical protein